MAVYDMLPSLATVDTLPNTLFSTVNETKRRSLSITMDDSMVDYMGNVVVREPKRRKVLDDRDICSIEVSEERYEAAISSIVANNCCNPQEMEAPMLDNPSESCNPQGGEADFMHDDGALKSAVADLSVCYDKDLHSP